MIMNYLKFMFKLMFKLNLKDVFVGVGTGAAVTRNSPVKSFDG